MNKNQSELKAVQQQLSEVALEAKSITDAQNKGDAPEGAEATLGELITKSETLKETKAAIEDRIAVEEQVIDLGKNIAVKTDEADRQPEVEAKSIGDQFVESKNFRSSAAMGTPKAVNPVEIKATLTEAAGGAGLITPQYQPGVLPKLFQPLTIADLLASGTTVSPTVTYMRETTANLSAVTTVAEGGVKPEIELAYEQTSAQVKKIAGFLPVTDEMLEDASQLSSYINGRLSLAVKIAEENQLLNGAGSGSELSGLLHNVPSGNKTLKAAGLTRQNMADNIYAGMTKIRTFFLEPDAIVVNPEDWAVLRLAKDAQGQYLGGSPFSNTGSNPGDSLFGKPVVITTAVSAGTALVGAFQTCAQIFRKSGLVVETTNSHAEFFRTNLTAVRAEERLALAIYRPEGFATVNTAATS